MIMIQAHQQVNVPRVPIEACRIALLLLITEEHRREIRGPLVPRRRIGRRQTKLLARRVGARGSTRKGLAGCGLGSAHERGSEWYCGIRSLADHLGAIWDAGMRV